MTPIALARSWWRFGYREPGMLLLVAVFALLLPLANPRIAATDEVQYYVYLRSLRFDGDLDFANDYRRFAAINPRAGIEGSLLQPNRIRPATGRYGNIAPIGAAIMWAPFFVLADGLVHLANAFGAGIAADGFSAPYLYAICYASALYGLLGLLLSYRLARRYASQFATSLASLALWLATPLVFYMFVQMAFAHATGFFLVALFLTIWQATRADDRGATTDERTRQPPDRARSWRAWIALGFVGGLMTMTREQLGLFLLVPAVEALAEYWRILTGAGRPTPRLPLQPRVVQGAGQGPRQSSGQAIDDRQQPATGKALPTRASRLTSPHSRLPSRVSPLASLAARHALFLVVFLLTLTPQLVVYQVLNGSPRPAGEVSGKLNLCSPHLIDTLIDYDPRPSAWCGIQNDPSASFAPFAHGAFIWSPVLVPALTGLALLWRRDRLAAAMLGLAFAAQTYINGAFGTTWHLSGAFGFRRLIECTPIFLIGLALVLDWAARRVDRRALVVPVALLVAWNAGLVLNWAIFHPELRKGLIWPELWRWQLETPVRLAAQVGDLLFNRCRFVENSGC